MYLGRHHYQRRSGDGYTIIDMVRQLESALSAASEVVVGWKMTKLHNKIGRDDGYGRWVRDQAVLELTARKPRAEVFSVIPKGDGK